MWDGGRSGWHRAMRGESGGGSAPSGSRDSPHAPPIAAAAAFAHLTDQQLDQRRSAQGSQADLYGLLDPRTCCSPSLELRAIQQ